MKYNEIVKKLQEENKGKIVLVRNGIFYCGIGKDAVLMHEILGYGTICFKKGICKCGIPVNAIEIAIPKMIRSGYNYIIFDYDKEEKGYKEIMELKGRSVGCIENNIGCDNCWYKENKNKSTKEYIEEFEKLVEKIDG